MFVRNSIQHAEQLLEEFRILYLTGPRQAGKTTLAKYVAQERGMLYLSLDEGSVLASAKSDPFGFIAGLDGRNVVLDEFQYAPELIPAIKLASDRLKPHQRGKFFITGSADIFSAARTQEALPGHMARLELYPLSVTEMHSGRFNLIDYLTDTRTLSLTPADRNGSIAKPLSRGQLAAWVVRGGYPEVQSKSPRSQGVWYKSYVQGRLFKDFDTLYSARGEYHDKLSALIPYLAGLSANLLKYASVANDLAQNDKVVKSYVEALEWMFIVKRIRPFIKNSARRQSLGMPKLHMVDTGLACHLLNIRTPEQLMATSYFGALVETLIVMECFKHLAWSKDDAAIFHFRDTQKNEVDIVLEASGGGLIGVEVKASATIVERDFKGLYQFATLVGKKFQRGVLLYGGSQLLPFRIGEFNFYAVPIGILFAAK